VPKREPAGEKQERTGPAAAQGAFKEG
jgi:hypothetical protein